MSEMTKWAPAEEHLRKNLDSGALLWIECNARWGGVSVPMTLISRLVGDWQSRSFVIVHRFGLRLRARGFADVMAQLRDRLFRPGGPPKGIVWLTPDAIEEGSGLHFLVLGDTKGEVLAEAKEIASLLNEGDACAGSTDSAQPNRPKSNAHSSMPRMP